MFNIHYKKDKGTYLINGIPATKEIAEWLLEHVAELMTDIETRYERRPDC